MLLVVVVVVVCVCVCVCGGGGVDESSLRAQSHVIFVFV